MTWQKALHTRYLHDSEAFLAECNPDARPWQEMPDDGLLYDHLAESLLDADREDELHALFDDDRWMCSRYEQSRCTHAGFLHDLKLAWEQSALSGVADNPHALARCVHYALLRAAVHTLCHAEVHPHQVAYDFAPRLIISDREAAFHRAYHAALALEHNVAWRRALHTATAIDTASGRAAALALAALKLPADQTAHALDSALRIDNAYYRARAVSALAQTLSGAARERAQSLSPAISSLSRRALRSSAIWQTLFAPLARMLEPAVELPRRLGRWLWIFHLGIAERKYRPAARACVLPGPRGQAARESNVNVNDLKLLKALIPHLSANVLARTLDKVIAHRCEDGKARAIPWFGPYVASDRRVRCLDGALGLDYAGDRARALVGLAPYLSPALRARALSVARAFDDARLRAMALLALYDAGNASASLIPEIREAVAEWLLHEDNRTFDEVVLLCFDDALLRPPVVSRKALLSIHRSIAEISHRWRWP